MPLSPLESLLFLVLLATSSGLFWRRFGPVLSTIRAARREPGYTPDPFQARLRGFVWEVLLQGKVIRDRPWPGVAHALVFWGFLAFALVTVAHFAEGVHLHLLPRNSVFATVYRALVAVFAAGVSVSIVGLAIRRFLVRPRWLGEISRESGLIALLIFVLMVTFLLTFRIADASPAGKLNWWAHTLALLAFLPLIPRTKHLHLLLSPVTVFLKRPGFGLIPPLEGDEDFGLDTGKDLTQVMALQAYSCVECGRCTEHCPATNTGKILNPKEIVLGVRRYLTEHGPGGEAPLLGVHLSEEAAFQCTTCGACEDQCPVGIQHLAVIVGLRRGAVNTGRWENSHGTRLFLNLERHGNPMGFGAAERQKFLQKHAIPFYDGTQEYCLWLGCMGSYDPSGQETVLALIRVLRYLGLTFGVLRKERCTGDAARRLGNDLLFTQLAEANIQTLRAAGSPRLLSICPHCVRTMAEDWKECGASFSVEHHSSFLARMATRLPGGTREGGVVYHDPCYLGRYRDSYEEPRAVIARHAGEALEPERTRHRSRCCGAGGGLVFLGEETGTRVSHDRARELAATGARTVASACPFCRTMFRDALAQIPEAPQLVDLAQLAASNLPDHQ